MATDDPHIKETFKNLDAYASIGLRTLLLAKREVPYYEYEEWR